jgi:hypothetical protein
MMPGYLGHYRPARSRAALAAVLCLGCAVTPAPPAAQTAAAAAVRAGGSSSQQPDPQQYEVLSAVLQQVVLAEAWGGDPGGGRRPIGRLVISTEQFPIGGIVDAWRARLPSLEDATVADFLSHTEMRLLAREFTEIGPYELLSFEENRRLGGWDSFYERFPDAPGYVRFSQVGFDSTRSQALVSMVHTRGGSWGNGALYLLRRTDAGWRIIEKVTTMLF